MTVTAPLLPPKLHTVPFVPKPSHISNSRLLKKPRLADIRPEAGLDAELGELIARDVGLVTELGWEEFIKRRRGSGDLTETKDVKHPAR